MSRDQIEEMAVTTCSLYRRYLDKKCGGNSDCDFNCHHYTRCENLYNAGYRKQSAVIDEFAERLKKRLYDKPSIFTQQRYIVNDEIDNLVEEMKGGTE